MGTSAPGASVPAGGGLGLQGEGPPGPPRVKRQLRVEMGGDRAREGGQRVGREQGGGLTSGQTPAGGHSGHSQSTREPAGRSHHLSVCSASACPAALLAPSLGLREAPRWSVSRRIRAAGLVPGSSPVQRAPCTPHAFTRAHVCTLRCMPTRTHGTHIPVCAHNSHTFAMHTSTRVCPHVILACTHTVHTLTFTHVYSHTCSHTHTHTYTRARTESSWPGVQGCGPHAPEAPAASSGALAPWLQGVGGTAPPSCVGPSCSSPDARLLLGSPVDD